MKIIKKSLILLIYMGLAGCGPISSNFSCNATAGDSCLTIEQVDAMTRFSDDVKPYSSRKNMMKAESKHLLNQGKIVKQDNGQALWLAKTVKEQSWA
ncbi:MULTISPECIES: TraV family lipoprotein [Legionellaceae]|uniref:Conjugative transfer protein n=1 Tax=Legionella bozemanae TaxID=447 RepID=A0A0W0R9F0_LEGBO|nr:MULTISPECIES: TraV family lipoprotein [Legionellaceae]KTC67702.1 conjugative transfer protein [Legionella bozemanae]MCW8497079.1 TraV family lipoprotein [Fluoribacter dumoffii]STO32891.1 conjugal transfer protein TraV [Legionella bozemanae]